MRCAGRSLKIASLFALLAAVILLPALFMGRQQEAVLERVGTYPVEVVDLEQNGGKEVAPRSVWERLEEIKIATTRVSSVKRTQLKQTDRLLLVLEEQTSLMQSMGALPKFELTGFAGASCTQGIHMRTERPELAVSMWVIEAAYQDMSITAIMDCELSAIYRLSILTNEGVIIESDIDGQKRAFFDYLNTFGEPVEYAGDWVDVSCLVSKDETYFYLTSLT